MSRGLPIATWETEFAAGAGAEQRAGLALSHNTGPPSTIPNASKKHYPLQCYMTMYEQDRNRAKRM